jgi:hypothetical protein
VYLTRDLNCPSYGSPSTKRIEGITDTEPDCTLRKRNHCHGSRSWRSLFQFYRYGVVRQATRVDDYNKPNRPISDVYCEPHVSRHPHHITGRTRLCTCSMESLRDARPAIEEYRRVQCATSRFWIFLLFLVFFCDLTLPRYFTSVSLLCLRASTSCFFD